MNLFLEKKARAIFIAIYHYQETTYGLAKVPLVVADNLQWTVTIHRTTCTA